jgi:hypothetical protein
MSRKHRMLAVTLSPAVLTPLKIAMIDNLKMERDVS